VVQKLAGVLLLVPLLGFVISQDRRAQGRGEGTIRWLLIAGFLLAAVEVATNLVPLGLAELSDLSPATARSLTLVEDLADAALFVLIAFFSLVAARAERSWVGIVGLV